MLWGTMRFLFWLLETSSGNVLRIWLCHYGHSNINWQEVQSREIKTERQGLWWCSSAVSFAVCSPWLPLLRWAVCWGNETWRWGILEMEEESSQLRKCRWPSVTGLHSLSADNNLCSPSRIIQSSPWARHVHHSLLGDGPDTRNSQQSFTKVWLCKSWCHIAEVLMCIPQLRR